MFIVLLKFSDNKDNAAQFVQGHKAWLEAGFADGTFLLAGTLKGNLGGGILAHNISQVELERLVSQDPFVAENVVTSEILEMSPSMADDRLNFLTS